MMMRAALFLATVVLTLCLVILVAEDRPVPSFGPLYSVYAMTLLALAGCSLLTHARPV